MKYIDHYDGDGTDMLGFEDWDYAWDMARLLLCHGGNPIGNVLVFCDGLAFRSPYEPGRRQTTTERATIAAKRAQ